MLTPLTKLDIVLSMFNQEHLIERVLYGIFKNTTTPFRLVLVFDGCTDRTEQRVLRYIKRYRPTLLAGVVVEHAANVYETRANNIGYKLATTDYMITLQDDMVINELGWEKRLTYPLRAFDDVIAVTARTAQNIGEMGTDPRKYFTDQVARELGNLPRTTFVVRDGINRGPIAFRMAHLRAMNYLNDQFAPSDMDDADLCLRAWKAHKWRAGAFWIEYISRLEWGKTRAKDSTMQIFQTIPKNAGLITRDHADYIKAAVHHDQDIEIAESTIDYDMSRAPSVWYRFYAFPLRRTRKELSRALQSAAKSATFNILHRLGIHTAEELGIKRALLQLVRPIDLPRPMMSVCLPVYDMKYFAEFTRRVLDSLVMQSFKDFDVIVSDQSKIPDIENICKTYSDKLNIRYYRKTRGPFNFSSSMNFAMKRARGKLIKMLCQDDFLFHKDALRDIVNAFDLKRDHWLVTASEHTRDGKTFYMPFYPKYNDKIHLGNNTISSPSVLTILNEKPLFFEEKLLWITDCDYYKRLHDAYGEPKIINTVNVVNAVGDHQVSNVVAGKELRGREYRRMLIKYHETALLREYDKTYYTWQLRIKRFLKKIR